jgi:hypothetical protein
MENFCFFDLIPINLFIKRDYRNELPSEKNKFLPLFGTLNFIDTWRCGSNSWSTTLEVGTVTITPPWLELMIYHTRSEHSNNYTTVARTHDLPH